MGTQLEYLTSFKRDCDSTSGEFSSITAKTCWNTWPHLKGIATDFFSRSAILFCRWNTWPHLKGIATLHTDTYSFLNLQLEYLTSFKRDCDFNTSLFHLTSLKSWNTWPHLKGIATNFYSFHKNLLINSWNTWPHLKGIATHKFLIVFQLLV